MPQSPSSSSSSEAERDALLPCPFCGGLPSLARCGFGTARVTCLYCGSEGAYRQSHADAIDSWNHRATPPSLPIDFKQASEQGGWQWVPKEPTEAMLTAASQASMQHLLDCINDPAKANALGSEENVRKTYASRYREMLAAAPPVVDDLSALVARLARALRKAAPGNDLSDKAVDYLRRNGLQGSPLRSPHPEEGALLLGGDEGGKKGGA